MASAMVAVATPAPATSPVTLTPENINGNQKKNRIQVSNTKKPLFFYVNLAKVSTISIHPISTCRFSFLNLSA